MDLQEAVAKARKILDEERRYPTVGYRVRPPVAPKEHDAANSILNALQGFSGMAELRHARSTNPRTIQGDPLQFEFHSDNYELLSAICGRLLPDIRSQFIEDIASQLRNSLGCIKRTECKFPSWKMHASEFPLIAEFAVRNGATKCFLNCLSELSASPALVVLLIQLEDMISLSFTVFPEADYPILRRALVGLHSSASRMRRRMVGSRNRTHQWPKLGDIDALEVCDQIRGKTVAISELCRKAEFLYLQGALREGLNLEVNQDKKAVEDYLQRLGFSKPLVESLHAADRLNHAAASAFDLKASMGQIRSFLENLHAQAIPGITASMNLIAPEAKWGLQLAFLRNNNILSKQEEKFVAGIYDVISDEAVHPLIADREYARLARNVVIEYALLFLTKLDKLGINALQPRS